MVTITTYSYNIVVFKHACWRRWCRFVAVHSRSVSQRLPNIDSGDSPSVVGCRGSSLLLCTGSFLATTTSQKWLVHRGDEYFPTKRDSRSLSQRGCSQRGWIFLYNKGQSYLVTERMFTERMNISLQQGTVVPYHREDVHREDEYFPTIRDSRTLSQRGCSQRGWIFPYNKGQ